MNVTNKLKLVAVSLQTIVCSHGICSLSPKFIYCSEVQPGVDQVLRSFTEEKVAVPHCTCDRPLTAFTVANIQKYNEQDHTLISLIESKR